MSVKQIVMAAAGLGGAAEATYIEDVFSTYLYTGNGSTQTITNGIDLSGEGGLVWLKSRSAAYDHKLHDTARGITNWLASNTTGAQQDSTTGGVTSANSNGFSLGSFNGWNASGTTFTSWTFRKAEKFFDVVTYTGNGNEPSAWIPHNLGAVPGMIVIKRTDAGGASDKWYVWHRTLADYNSLQLNETAAVSQNFIYKASDITSTQFRVFFGGTNIVNINGATYVAYLFAHDAGGFGDDGSENVISCGSYTGNNSSQSITIGYEPQWILVKNITASSDWQVLDVMRGMSYTAFSPLYANLSNAEITGTSYRFEPTATGWNFPSAGAATYNTSGNTYIYIAIRRGPMKTPTSGTEVFKSITYTPTNTNGRQLSVGFNSDMYLWFRREGDAPWITDRLRDQMLGTSLTSAETTASGNVNTCKANNNNNLTVGATEYSPFTSANYGTTGRNYLIEAFQRAPGFFDVVCFKGSTSSNPVVNHNLVVSPELVIFKRRSSTADSWWVYATPLGSSKYLTLNTTNANSTYSGFLTPSSTTITITKDFFFDTGDYIAYLFATCPGVSKVGSYTGNGSSQTINCGFTGGARFVLIKRTDSTGNWTVFDSARGIVAGNDPALYLNSTAAEVTTADAVDTDSTGFIVNQESTLNLNLSSATYIFLAIA